MPRYEFVQGKSQKFWEITLEGKAFTTCWGRLGTEGQSATKTFPNAAKAKMKYDKLVVEKVKKGYQLVGGAEEEAATDTRGALPAEAGRAPAESSRRDVYVYNEATGFVLTSASLKGRGWEDEAWDRAVARGDLFPVELVQDDSFIIRVVLKGELQPQEENEWVGRLAWHLRVPDGRLAISAGAEFIIEAFEDFVHYLDVPACDYRAVLYAYLNGVNGQHLLGLATPGQEPEPVGKYFRRTRGDREFPDWLQDWCTAYPDKDPGHEEEWHGRKPLETAARFVDFLLHLTPLEKPPKAAPQLEQGFFAWNSFEARQPALCPLGLLAREVVDLPEKRTEQPWVFQPVDVGARVEAYRPAPLAGGPVEVPLEKMGRVYRLVWFAYDSSDVEIRITLPPGSAFSPNGQARKGVVYQPGQGALRVGFRGDRRQVGHPVQSGRRWAADRSAARPQRRGDDLRS